MTKSRIFPTWEQISSFRNPLTSGEFALAKFLDAYLPKNWEIFIQPYLNGDRPDIVILNLNVGMMVFEVKDWNPANYYFKEVWYYDKRENKKKKGKQYYVRDSRGEYHIPNPIRQVERYRENLINLYSPNIGEAIDRNPKNLSVFKIALYFHKMSTEQAKELVDVPNKVCIVFGNDKIQNGKVSLKDVVPDYDRQMNSFMKKVWYEDIRFWLIPPFHSLEQGLKLTLNKEQKRHVDPSPNQHQRLRGVAGSGKTLVLAQRAANLASNGKKVLIVTYNITLCHYIRDHISRARYNFEWKQIEFTHFHGLCKNYLIENDIIWPSSDEYSDEEFLWTILPMHLIEKKEEGKNKKRREYDAILIDEGQDFCKNWYDMLCKFLSNNNELLMVVDEKQNVYRRDINWIDSMQGTQFRGRWRELKESYRIPFPIMEQANKFAENFLTNIGIPPIPNEYQHEFFKPHYVWRNINSFSEAKSKILAAIRWLTGTKKIHPQDIIVLVPTHKEGWELVKLLEDNKYLVNHVFEDESRSHHHKKSFWMGDSRLKMSTIHSFKGWELMNVIILTPPKAEGQELEATLDYLIYTSITRTRNTLIVFNRHSKYNSYGDAWPKSW